jgi:hypothetical protein
MSPFSTIVEVTLTRSLPVPTTHDSQLLLQILSFDLSLLSHLSCTNCQIPFLQTPQRDHLADPWHVNQCTIWILD